MPRTRFDWIVLTIVFVLVGGAWTLTSRVPAEAINPAGKPPAPQVGYLAPDFTAKTLTGKTFTLREARGTPVVLNFWATWCPPCRAEIPHFESIWKERGGAVMFVGVNVGESPG
ncbi:MAG: redoxin domain-containing protein, partial [Chloroflexi bacterium]|nr:redoxin domain-containing protein [Chloroflexota bacterium]